MLRAYKVEKNIFSLLKEKMESIDNLSNVWETLGKDLKLLILRSLSVEDRLSFCQSDRRISSFCREYNLTGYDATIQKWNPWGQLVDSKEKLVDYIERGYDTIYSLVLTESDDDGTPPSIDDVKILGIKPGLEKGTSYGSEQPNHYSAYFYYHLSFPGLPPVKGSPLKIIAFMHSTPFMYFDITTYVYQNEKELDELLLANQEVDESNWWWKYTDEDIKELKSKGFIVHPEGLSAKVALYEFPCP